MKKYEKSQFSAGFQSSSWERMMHLLRFKTTSLGRGGGYRLCIKKCSHPRSLQSEIHWLCVIESR